MLPLRAIRQGRPPAPDDLKTQFGLIRDFLQACKLPVISKAGFEADDLLGTAARLADEQGIDSIILTGDRDALQLASDRCSILITRKGISESLLLNPEGVKANYGVYPHQITDLKGLMGDSSDNIPGVPGVGEKTALKLLDEYGDIENLIAHADDIKGKLGEKIRDNTDIARFSKKLATIVCTAPLDIDFEEHNVLQMQSGLPLMQEHHLNRVSLQLKALFDEGGIYHGLTDHKSEGFEIQIEEIQGGSTHDAWHLVNKALPENDPGFTTLPAKTAELDIADEAALADLDLSACTAAAVYCNEKQTILGVYTDLGLELRIALRQDMITPGIHIVDALQILLPKLAGKALIVHGQKQFLSLLDDLNCRSPLPTSSSSTW